MKLREIIPLLALFSASLACSATKVACVGDSITFGSGIAAHEPKYPDVLAKLFGDGFEVKNFGNPGKTAGDFPSQKSRGRWYGDTKEYKDSLEYKADIYICNLGINDTGAWWNPKQFKDGYETLTKGWKTANPKATLFAWGLLGPDFRGAPGKKTFPGNVFAPEFQFAVSDNGSSTNRETAEKLIGEVYKPHGGSNILFDAYSSLANHPEWFKDGLHPTAPGASRIAEITFAKLAASLPPALIAMPTPETRADEKSVTIFNPGKSAILLDGARLYLKTKKLVYEFSNQTVIPPGGEISVSLDPDVSVNEVDPTKKLVCKTNAKGADLILVAAPKGAAKSNRIAGPLLRLNP